MDDAVIYLNFYPRDAMLARYLLSPRVHLSVTSQYCIKTAKRRISKTTPHDSPGLQFYDAKDLYEILME